MQGYLFWLFAQIGVCTFGGGYAMLPLLQRELVEKRGWVEEEELMDYYAIGQCTPGIIAINTATFIGYKRKKLAGGIAATLGFVFPSVIIITLIAAFMRNFASLKIVSGAFSGIRVCVCALIADAVLKLYKKAVIDKCSAAIFLAVVLLSVFTKVLSAVIVLAAGLFGYFTFQKGETRHDDGN
ncbi:MAG: chromate transporter [Hungatella sp.]|nr:chromate transporter [Hungatella sp.]